MCLTDDEIAHRLLTLPRWYREGDALVCDFDRVDFNGSIAFVNAIATVANEMNHHPDISIAWNHVVVRISSHDVRAITARDFTFACKLQSLASSTG